MTLKRILASLKKRYGPGRLPEPVDPFAAVVWENCAYLVDDARREATFENLRKRVGITPRKLVAAGVKAIEPAIREGGMQPVRRAQKVLRCAEIAVAYADGDLADALARGGDRERRRLLKRFPGIGDPGVDKLLLIGGYADVPALESNGLRVLERIGAIPEGSPYASAYREGVRYIGEQRADALDAFILLREHGRTLCKRTNRQCGECPLRSWCPSSTV